MAWYLARRLAASVVVLLAISFCVYLLFYSGPSDPARVLCGKPCQPERLSQIKQFMGTDKSAVVQWVDFVKGLFVGRTYGTGAEAARCAAPCFGFSFDQRQSVTSLIWSRLPITASIAIGGAVVSLIVGMTLGPLAARFRGGVLDGLVRGGSLLLVAMPAYLLGLLAILVFGFQLNMVPVSGYVPLSESPVDWAWHLILPWCVLGLINGAAYARYARNQMLDELGSDYLLAERATGASARRVRRTARRSVWVPVTTLFGIDLALMLGGTIFTEKVFSMHGIGDLLLGGVSSHDLGIVVGTALFGAALIIVGNLIVDIVQGFIDPRVRRG
ncbi:ABC transporter permease [Flexivirga meconopsidis]|uniref:ABC transporter permease n=1 Tax=Flexivirga meconopsidis TaxID=2977121 RepID=UPI00223F01AC|nr:ABC transporter permease [Flexivirga meconopsidis]